MQRPQKKYRQVDAHKDFGLRQPHQHGALKRLLCLQDSDHERRRRTTGLCPRPNIQEQEILAVLIEPGRLSTEDPLLSSSAIPVEHDRDAGELLKADCSSPAS